jgi:hypothetical protein
MECCSDEIIEPGHPCRMIGIDQRRLRAKNEVRCPEIETASGKR